MTLFRQLSVHTHTHTTKSCARVHTHVQRKGSSQHYSCTNPGCSNIVESSSEEGKDGAAAAFQEAHGKGGLQPSSPAAHGGPQDPVGMRTARRASGGDGAAGRPRGAAAAHRGAFDALGPSSEVSSCLCLTLGSGKREQALCPLPLPRDSPPCPPGWFLECFRMLESRPPNCAFYPQNMKHAKLL